MSIKKFPPGHVSGRDNDFVSVRCLFEIVSILNKLCFKSQVRAAMPTGYDLTVHGLKTLLYIDIFS